MKKILTIIAAIVVVGALVGGGFYLGTRKNNSATNTTNASQPTVKVSQKKPDLTAVLENLKKQYPTIQKTYIYSEQQDPNDELGKPGYYVAGAEFYDTRTNTPPDGDAFGADSGGAIEVYANESDAAKRVAYLQQFQGSGALDPGAFKQIGTVVVRASSQYTKSQQDEMINYLASQLQ